MCGAGAVFEIEEEPVEAGERGNFSDDGRAERQPRADEWLRAR